LKTRTGKNGTGRYYIVDESRDIALPSVTTIIGETSDKSGLKNWENRVGKEEAARISKFSANRGTYMHALHEHYLDALYVDPQENALQYAFLKSAEDCPDLTEDEKNCGKDLFFNFLNRSEFYNQIQEVIHQEIPVWSLKGGGYAGRLDLFAKSEGKRKLIDFKTSRKPKREEWIEGYKLQASAYSVALFERTGVFPDCAEIWISCETGEVQCFHLTIEDLKTNFVEFHKRTKQYHEKHPIN
jgi:hypothetical protein